VGERSFESIRVRDAGAVAIGGNVTITGDGYAAGRDVTVNDPGTPKQPRT
jgi:hypothetical protein